MAIAVAFEAKEYRFESYKMLKKYFFLYYAFLSYILSATEKNRTYFFPSLILLAFLQYAFFGL